MLIHVHMRTDQDTLVVMMLQVGEFFAEFVQIMVVKQGYRTHGFSVVLPLPSDKLLADHIPDKLRAVGVPTGPTQLLQLLEQGLFYGKTQSG